MLYQLLIKKRTPPNQASRPVNVNDQHLYATAKEVARILLKTYAKDTALFNSLTTEVKGTLHKFYEGFRLNNSAYEVFLDQFWLANVASIQVDLNMLDTLRVKFQELNRPARFHHKFFPYEPTRKERVNPFTSLNWDKYRNEVHTQWTNPKMMTDREVAFWLLSDTTLLASEACINSNHKLANDPLSCLLYTSVDPSAYYNHAQSDNIKHPLIRLRDAGAAEDWLLGAIVTLPQLLTHDSSTRILSRWSTFDKMDPFKLVDLLCSGKPIESLIFNDFSQHKDRINSINSLKQLSLLFAEYSTRIPILDEYGDTGAEHSFETPEERISYHLTDIALTRLFMARLDLLCKPLVDKFQEWVNETKCLEVINLVIEFSRRSFVKGITDNISRPTYGQRRFIRNWCYDMDMPNIARLYAKTSDYLENTQNTLDKNNDIRSAMNFVARGCLPLRAYVQYLLAPEITMKEFLETIGHHSLLLDDDRNCLLEDRIRTLARLADGLDVKFAPVWRNWIIQKDDSTKHLESQLLENNVKSAAFVDEMAIIHNERLVDSYNAAVAPKINARDLVPALNAPKI